MNRRVYNFFYFPRILHQTMGDLVTWPHINSTEHAQNTGSIHWAYLMCQTCISFSNYINTPPKEHPSIRWPDLPQKTTWQLSGRYSIEHICLFLLLLLSNCYLNYVNYWNIVKTPSKTLHCTLQGYLQINTDVTDSQRLIAQIARFCLL